MLAISKSGSINPKKRHSLRYKSVISKDLNWIFMLAWLALLPALSPVWRANAALSPLFERKPEFAAHAEKVYKDAKARFQSQTNDAAAPWQFGRACFDWADFAPSNPQRADIATEGMAACNQLIARDGASAPGHYYLAMNMGQLAQTKKLGALKLVSQMETEFKTVLGADPKFDHAGADRGLGLLYYQAPGWPTSIGSKSKARQHLQKAVTIAPDFPENLMNLVEAESKWGEKSNALRDLKTLDDLWPTAQKQYSGDDWNASWADWTARRDAVRKKLNAKPVEFPGNHE
jgi:hypothetical protein